MPTPEYLVEKFLPKGAGNPGELQTKLNELAQQGAELVACVEVAHGVLWLILRKDRQ